jgi:hypothetical protein
MQRKGEMRRAEAQGLEMQKSGEARSVQPHISAVTCSENDGLSSRALNRLWCSGRVLVAGKVCVLRGTPAALIS